MRLLNKFLIAGIAALLASCGGGGGSGGDSKLQYSISLRSAKSQLPLNIANVGAGLGANAAYTTTLYVEAREGNSPILNGSEVFSCNLAQGLDTGSLYYLDGKPEHEKDGVPLAYRSVVLGANSGGATFHFHAGNQAGTARITCSVTNPRDLQMSTASADIVVGAATGKPASVVGVTQAPSYLGTKNNPNMVRNNVGVQAFLRDDSNQPIPNSTAANLQVSILPIGSAAEGARLVSGSQSGNVLQVRTIGGVGQISLSSGMNVGTIILQYVADRFDNDVTNGIQDPVTSLHPVVVVTGVPNAPLAYADEVDISVPNGRPFIRGLSASGGVPPYSWTYSGTLPKGLTIDTSGLLMGTAKDNPGDYPVQLIVTDANGVSVAKNVTVKLVGAFIEPIVFNITGCTGDINTPCVLPAATLGASYAYAFSATGGDSSAGYTWTFAGLPAWLTAAGASSNGLITSAAATPAGTYLFFVTVKSGTQSVTRQVSITVL